MLKLEKILTRAALAAALALSLTQVGYAGFDEAVSAYEAGDYKLAHDEWLPLARSNDPAAMRNLGHLYRRGLGVEQDFSKALSWYTRAAEMGFDRAQANVATMYLKGEGVEQSYEKASEWFGRAARNGHVIAQYNLGLMHEHGKGVVKSASKALGWYNLAAKAGHKAALDKLSILVARNPNIREEKPAIKPDTPVVVSKRTPEKPVQQSAPAVKPASVAAPKKPAIVKPEPVKPAAVAKAQKQPAPKMAAKPIVKTKPIAKPKQVAAPVKKPAIVAAPKVAAVSKPKPVIAAPAAKKPDIEKPAKVLAPAPLKNEKAPKKFDPFAGSANNLQATNSSAPKSSGAPTAFNQKKKIDTPEAATTASGSEPKKQETKGFFASLKSLIVGEQKPSSAPAATAGTTNSSLTPKSAETTGTAAAPTPAPEPVKRNIATIAKPAAPKVTAPTAPVVASRPVIAPQPAASPAPVQSSAFPVTGGGGLTLDEQLEMAELAFTLEEYQQALNVWAPLAQKGNAEAQYQLGNMFLEGHAVPVDRVRAYYWWDKARKGGSTKAGSSLSELEKTLTFLEKRQLSRSN